MTGTAIAGTLLPGVPLLVGLAGLLLPPGDGGAARRRVSAVLGIAGAAIALMVTVVLLPAAADAPVEHSTRWVRFGDLEVTLAFSAGPAALYVALAVTAVALAVQVYSVAYLNDDARYAPYAAQVSLFTGAMLLVVTSGDLILLLVGWEVMGICSYLLIGHDRRLPEAPAAAVKAFLVTRVGDVGFLLGIAILGVSAGGFRIADVLAHDYDPGMLTAALILILAGVAGKSAQFPLHTWLPDAMAGPTPISALIHAATMVAAGVYVVFRMFPLFEQSPAALAVLGVMAAITLLLGALSATAQDDLKRVLAWSTVSQIGYMTGALAVGSPAAALFHLLTHAAFKALLFLAAGSVIHAVGTNLMPDMGGLRKLMPVTFVTMTIGLAALAGIPPFSGFFSKEAVLGAAEETALHHEGPAHAWTGWLVLVVGLVTAAVTAAYVARLWLMTFLGTARSPVAAHESGPSMRWPLVVLAVPAAVLGLVGLPSGWLPEWLAPRVGTGPLPLGEGRPVEQVELHVGLLTSVLSVAAVVVGIGAMWLAWRRDRAADPTAAWRLRSALVHAFYVDDLYDRAVVRPVRVATRAVRRVDDDVVVGAVLGTGGGARTLARLVGRTQGGNVTTYLTGLVAGVLLVAAGVVVLT